MSLSSETVDPTDTWPIFPPVRLGFCIDEDRVQPLSSGRSPMSIVPSMQRITKSRCPGPEGDRPETARIGSYHQVPSVSSMQYKPAVQSSSPAFFGNEFLFLLLRYPSIYPEPTEWSLYRTIHPVVCSTPIQPARKSPCAAKTEILAEKTRLPHQMTRMLDAHFHGVVRFTYT